MTYAFETGEPLPITVYHRLRIARQHAGLSQDELADIMGVARSTVSNAELGKVKPRRITLGVWALACGVPLSWILGHEDDTRLHRD